MEDYLEAIFRLSESRRDVRVKQIAEVLGVSLPSVTSALKTLSEADLIAHQRYGAVELTEEGRARAQAICSRHGTLGPVNVAHRHELEPLTAVDVLRVQTPHSIPDHGAPDAHNDSSSGCRRGVPNTRLALLPVPLNRGARPEVPLQGGSVSHPRE